MQSDLVQKLATAIKRISGNRIRDLSIQQTGESVRLGGKSQSFYGKQLASHAAQKMGLDMGFEVENEIEVT